MKKRSGPTRKKTILHPPLWVMLVIMLGCCFSSWALVGFRYIHDQKQTPPLITVLCYHHVNAPYGRSYSVTTQQFIAQLDTLEAAGFTFISVNQLAAHIYKQEPLPALSALITFDDGNISNYTIVYPLLKKRHIPWVLFVYPTLINQGHRLHALNWSEVREMADNGVTIGSHSLYHPILTKPPREVCTPEQYTQWLEHQLINSRAIISEKVGKPVQYFAYPFGALDSTVYKKMLTCGYSLAFNVHGMNNGEAIDPLNINRLIVTAHMSPTMLLEMALTKPLYFNYRYPADLERVTGRSPRLEFSLKNKAEYVPASISSAITSIKSNPILEQTSEDLFAGESGIQRTGFYTISVSAKDRHGQHYKSNWLFRYDHVLPSYILH